MEYYESCPVCNHQMRITETGGDGEVTVITEECEACGHRDTYTILVTNQEVACNA